jgi:chromosome segregation ATPase
LELTRCRNAAVIVKLLNGGDDPYKPELYGDVITVERRFSRDGSSGYKLKSKSDRVVSTKRDDLQEILDHYQYQIDNPMTVLAQDNARMFLGTSSMDDKYRLFMKGVQLLQLDADYAMMEGTVTTMETTLESKNEALQELRQNDRRCRSQLQIFEQSTEIENQVRLLQKKFAWVQVKGAEEVTTLSFVQLFGWKLTLVADSCGRSGKGQRDGGEH